MRITSYIELDIVLPANLNNKFNVEGGMDSEHRRAPGTAENKDWPDLGIGELISKILYPKCIAQFAEPKLDQK